MYYEIIKFLLMGSFTSINIAALLFGITKDQKESIDNNSKPTLLSDLIYKNLKFISQSKLKKSDTIILHELEKINAINPDVNVITYQDVVHSGNIIDLISQYDFILDGTDNFSAKFLINDACVMAKKPFSHGGILRFDGQALTYVPGNACYRCIFITPPPKNAVPTCSQSGVLGAIAGILGTIQATEALKYITGVGDLLTNRLLVFDAKKMNFRTVKVKRNPKCPVCGDHPSITELIDYEMPVCDLKKA